MIITQTPVRLSLLGGNTDYPQYFKKYGGAVLSVTIDKYVYVIIKKRFDDEIWINYSVKEIVDNVKDIKHDLVRESMKLVGVTEGVEITFLSDIPSEGSGLGSSSAVTVGLLNALHNYKGESVTQRQLAQEACRIEVDILKKPIGYQDQYAVAFGGLNLIEFDNEITVESLVSDNLEKQLLLLYTGKTRSADKILSKMKLNKKILDRNKELAKLGATLVDDWDDTLGILLDEYWKLKVKLNNSVTDTNLNKLYDEAISAGAIGGKIVGAGGGGFFLFVVPIEKRDIVKRMLRLRELPFRLSKYGSRVIFQNE